jgi:DNA-binding transcriptional MerR regulator/predicted transcriptional regulator YdeE
MLTIGDFSKLSRVPITALRYYDEMGLLKPAAVDPQTNYRYYSLDQLPRLNRILTLKELGFGLSQIAQLLSEGLSREELQGMYRMKRAEIRLRVEQDQERLLQLEERLQQIDREGIVSQYDVLVKDVKPRLVASIRDIVPNYPHAKELLSELFAYLSSFESGGLAGLILHDEGYKESEVDLEAVVYLKNPVPASERVRVYELPTAKMASTVHRGSFATVSQAYGAIIQWIETNEWVIAGPNRELYLSISTPIRQDDASYLIEIQFPVEKRENHLNA